MRTKQNTGCSVDGCNNKHSSKGLCSIHYDRLRHSGRLHTVYNKKGERGVCSIADCDGGVHAKGLCDKHYTMQRVYGRTHNIRRKKGDGTITPSGYIMHSAGDNHVFAHRAIVAGAMGRKLPAGAVIHHVDGNGTNNNQSNLIVCPSQQYHALLHIRQDAYDACGDANKRQCCICREYDDVNNMYIGKRGHSPRHKACHSLREQKRRIKSCLS